MVWFIQDTFTDVYGEFGLVTAQSSWRYLLCHCLQSIIQLDRKRKRKLLIALSICVSFSFRFSVIFVLVSSLR